MFQNYSVYDIAKIAHSSKTTIKRAIDKLEIECVDVKGQTYLYTDRQVILILEHLEKTANLAEDTKEFYWKLKNGAEPPQTAPDQNITEPPPLQTAPDHATSETNRNNTETEQAAEQKTIEILEKQVEQLTEQIEKKDNEISNLMRLLEQNQVLLARQQGIPLLEDASQAQETIETEEPKKKSIWKRIFGL